MANTKRVGGLIAASFHKFSQRRVLSSADLNISYVCYTSVNVPVMAQAADRLASLANLLRVFESGHLRERSLRNSLS